MVWLLFLMQAASVTPSIYIVMSSRHGLVYGVDGVYEEKTEPELHYQKLGEEASNYYWFLYTDSRRPQTWIIGRGTTLSTARARYRAPAREGKPGVTEWSKVWDTWHESREGKDRGIPWPDVRVVGVETNITGKELANQLQREDIVTEEYIICKNHRWSLQIILRSSHEAAYCDAFRDCKSGSDEVSPYGPGKICENSKMYKITREEEEAGLDIEDEQGTIVCRSPEGKWLIITGDDPRFCDGVPHCKSELDEPCPYVIFRDSSKSAVERRIGQQR